MNKITTLALALSLAAVSAPAFAGEGAGAFVRGEIGTTEADVNGYETRDPAFTVRGGYNVNKHFGVEGFVGQYYNDEFLGTDAKATGYGVAMVVKHRFGTDKGFFIDGRVGLARTKLSIDTAIGDVDYSKTTPYTGVGFGYDFNERYGVSLNYAHQNAIKVENNLKVRLDTLSLGFEYRF